MLTTVLKQARVITPQELAVLRYPVPQSWLDVAGILKGKKKVNALAYQKQIRKEWDKRLNKLQRLTK
jgi:hypothetical protein